MCSESYTEIVDRQQELERLSDMAVELSRRAVARGVRESRGHGVTSAIRSDHTAASQSQKP